MTTVKAGVLLAFNAIRQSMETASPTEEESGIVGTNDEVLQEPPAQKPRLQSQLWDCMDEIVQWATVGQQQQTSNIETELAQYLSEPNIRIEDPLLWWRQNTERFRNMANVAPVYLCSPPTSVPSERLFSVAGEVISDHRSALLPENAARLIFLKYNNKLMKE